MGRSRPIRGNAESRESGKRSRAASREIRFDRFVATFSHSRMSERKKPERSSDESRIDGEIDVSRWIRDLARIIEESSNHAEYQRSLDTRSLMTRRSHVHSVIFEISIEILGSGKRNDILRQEKECANDAFFYRCSTICRRPISKISKISKISDP